MTKLNPTYGAYHGKVMGGNGRDEWLSGWQKGPVRGPAGGRASWNPGERLPPFQYHETEPMRVPFVGRVVLA